jgi:hypothetical protein
MGLCEPGYGRQAHEFEDASTVDASHVESSLKLNGRRARFFKGR